MAHKLHCPHCQARLTVPVLTPRIRCPRCGEQCIGQDAGKPDFDHPETPTSWGLIAALGGVGLFLIAGLALMIYCFFGSDNPASTAGPETDVVQISPALPNPQKLPNKLDEPDPEKKTPGQVPSPKLPENIPSKGADPPRIDKDQKKPVAFILDNFGNPIERVGLVLGKDFKGGKLLVWNGQPTENIFLFPDDNPLWKTLRDRGFTVTLKPDPHFDPGWLRDIDQVWIVAGMQNRMDEAGYQAVEKFVQSGKGLYLLADNDPYTVEATILTRRLFGTSIQGDYPGQKIAYVRQRNLTTQELSKYKHDFQIDEHPLFTGLNFVYEGITISHIKPTPKLKTVMHASDGKILVAAAADPRLRVIVDCGFTRYYYGPSEAMRFITKTAGTLRFGENIAVYLMGAGSGP